ncbi:MAG: hypothetical protein II505_04160 [Bacteroidaceae bacterium]|nr:hypothetical protein [Bacteroidaceae bacterium]
MERVKTFKTKYSPAELDELFAWFDSRMDRLPESLQVDEATYSANVLETVSAYIRTIKNCELTVSLNGYVSQLMLIRERLKQEGVE